MRELILGGARSGKSRYAAERARRSGLEVCCIVTAEALDAEMAERIARHRAERPGHWRTVESPRRLADTLAAEATPTRCLLVDCLTLWLSNLLCAGDEAALETETEALLTLAPTLPGRLLLVTNEVGWGVVPAEPLARRFRDEAGRLHQQLAERLERVTLVVAGQALALKTPS